MPTIHEPTSFATEQIVRLANVGQDRCFAVSGYADFSDEDDVDDGHPLNSPLHGAGTGSSDHRWFSVGSIHMVVGPKFHQVKDVSPIVNVAGYSFRDSDETDHTGFEITSCNWDSVAEAETGLERVRLKVRARMCGGEQSSLTILSYHFIVVGTVLSAVG
jgi:hypothetical protein